VEQSLCPKELTVLSASPLFRELPREQLTDILARPGCNLRTFPAEACIYRPDQFQRSLGVLLSGRVRVTKAPLTVSVLEPGALFGAAALYNDAPDYAATLTTLEPCAVLTVTQDLLDALLAENALLRHNYLCYLSGRIRFLSARLQSLAAGDVEGRLSRYLLSNLQGDRLACSATELARRIGVSRASLYRAFEALEDTGLIRREGKTIIVPDPAALNHAL
jgi:CRP-like cAMP-binding protein